MIDNQDSDEETRKIPTGRQLVAYDDLIEPKKDPLEDERKKHQARAQKFGVEFREPTKKNLQRVDLLRIKHKRRDGFVTGIDFLSEEERKKREERAAKYGSSLLGLTAEEVEANEKKQQRKERFGIKSPDPVDITSMDLDLLESRVDCSGDATPRYEAVCLYGVDLMSSSECLHYLRDYSPTHVEWINDSSCLVIFEDEMTAGRVMVTIAKKLPGSIAPVNLPDVAPEHLEMFSWHSGPAFEKEDGTSIPLQLRIGTSHDIRAPGPSRSRYLWQQNYAAGPRGQAPRGRKPNQKRKRDGSDMQVEEGEAEGAAATAAGPSTKPPVVPTENLETDDLRRKIWGSDLRSRLDTGGVILFDEDDEDDEDKKDDEEEERPAKRPVRERIGAQESKPQVPKTEYRLAKRLLKSIVQA